MTIGSEGTNGVPAHIEHRITAPDGRTLAVAEWGDPDGLPLFGLHGTPGGRISCWEDPTIYARHGLRRLTVDRPGYGHSTRLRGRSVADFAADIATIADALGIGEFAVTGGSGGGPHALACAALLRERVLRCLAEVSVAPFGPEGLEPAAWMAGMTAGNVVEFEAAVAGETAMRAVCDPERRDLLQRLADGRPDVFGDGYELSESDRAQLVKHMGRLRDMLVAALEPGADGWIDDNLAMVRPWGFQVQSIAVPVLLVYGRADTLVPAAHGDWLAAQVPGAQVEVTESGHMGADEEMERHMAWLAGRG